MRRSIVTALLFIPALSLAQSAHTVSPGMSRSLAWLRGPRRQELALLTDTEAIVHEHVRLSDLRAATEVVALTIAEQRALRDSR